MTQPAPINGEFSVVSVRPGEFVVQPREGPAQVLTQPAPNREPDGPFPGRTDPRARQGPTRVRFR